MVNDDWKVRLDDAAQSYRNWGRWGPDDQVGTLNFITDEIVREAAGLVRQGRVFSLAIDFDERGPQTGGLRRFNAMSFMLRDGDDAYSREMAGVPRGIGGSDDVVIQATHGATHWDALAHIFYDSKMWNGYDCRLVSSFGAERNDISSYRDRIVGQAVLLDLPRYLGVPWCQPGQAISSEQLEGCAAAQGVTIQRGDFVLLRFGQLCMVREQGAWGDYAGGDAPGLDFETLGWIHQTEIAGVASDTWGVEVRPNPTSYCTQPWHRIALPSIGLLVGEMFDLEAIADDCAEDGVYRFFFCANPAPVTGSVGGPVNPTGIK